MKNEKKLNLNKTTVAHLEDILNPAAMNNVRGGTGTTTTQDTSQPETNTPMFC